MGSSTSLQVRGTAAAIACTWAAIASGLPSTGCTAAL